MKRELLIFGSGEIASLAKYYFEKDSEFRVVAFTVDDGFVESDTYEGKPLVPLSDAYHSFPSELYPMHVALSYSGLNRLRQQKYENMKRMGYKLVSYVCSKSMVWPDVRYGDNCFILENQTIQPTVTIGNNVVIWSGNHLGHGTVISDHVYIASHVVISGNCRIGERCFLGVNSTVKDFTTIEDECFIGMGASVVRDVKKGAIVVGASSQVLLAEDKRAQKIKARYFGI